MSKFRVKRTSEWDDCEEPIGTVERYCWNCDADVVAPVAAFYPFADYLDDLLAEADDA